MLKLKKITLKIKETVTKIFRKKGVSTSYSWENNFKKEAIKPRIKSIKIQEKHNPRGVFPASLLDTYNLSIIEVVEDQDDTDKISFILLNQKNKESYLTIKNDMYVLTNYKNLLISFDFLSALEEGLKYIEN
jgi:hypothetical protein